MNRGIKKNGVGVKIADLEPEDLDYLKDFNESIFKDLKKNTLKLNVCVNELNKSIDSIKKSIIDLNKTVDKGSFKKSLLKFLLIYILSQTASIVLIYFLK